MDRVEQRVVFVPSDRKRDLLAALLRDPAFARVLVFPRTKHGATAFIQPGGSVNDPNVIAAADKLGVAMVFTGVRHFRH